MNSNSGQEFAAHLHLAVLSVVWVYVLWEDQMKTMFSGICMGCLFVGMGLFYPPLQLETGCAALISLGVVLGAVFSTGELNGRNKTTC